MRSPPSIARTVFGRNKKTPLGMQAKTAFDRRAFGRDKKNASIPDGVSGKRLKREIGNGAPNAQKPKRGRKSPSAAGRILTEESAGAKIRIEIAHESAQIRLIE